MKKILYLFTGGNDEVVLRFSVNGKLGYEKETTFDCNKYKLAC
jgi:hypothetical protein